MAQNILVQLQEALGYPALLKIDPNTDVVKENNENTSEDAFSQAAIPAILTGMYKYVQSEAGATDFLTTQNRPNWMEVLFATHKKEAIQTIAAYAKQSNEDPLAKMNTIANKASELILLQIGDATVDNLRQYFKSQKAEILLYLPTALGIGELLNDAMLDDTINRMEGPITNLMQSIGNVFNTPIKPS